MGQQFRICCGDWEGDNRSFISLRAFLGKFPEMCYESYPVNAIRFLLRKGPLNVLTLGDEVVDNYAKSQNELDQIIVFDTYPNVFEGDEDMVSKLTEKRAAYANIEIDLPSEYDSELRDDEYIINHTKRQYLSAIRYKEKSYILYIGEKKPYYIDPIMALTETGGGVQITVFNGVSTDEPIEAAGQWAKDMLQIATAVPDGYTEISYGVAEFRQRSMYCVAKYGFDENGRVFCDSDGNFLQARAIGLMAFGPPNCVSIHFDEGVYSIGPTKEDETQRVVYNKTMAVLFSDLIKKGNMATSFAEKLSGVSFEKLSDDANGYTFLKNG